MDPYLSLFKALADGTRLRLLRVLGSGTFHVNELVRILELGQSRVSRHLKVLLDAGLVGARREGSWVYYTLAPVWTGRSSARNDPSRTDGADATANGAGADRQGAGGAGSSTARFLRLFLRELGARESAESRRDREAVGVCLEERRRRAERFFRGVAGDWDAHRGEVEGPPEHLGPLVEVLDRLRAQGGGTGAARRPALGTAVDLGTGTGLLLGRLSERSERVLGIDSAPEMLAVAARSAREHGLPNVELRLGALEHLPVSDAEADTMVAHMVLHHVADPPGVLREIRRGLRADGRFVIADFTAHEEESYRERLGDLWLGFERRDIERWLDAAGFEVREVIELGPAARRPGVLIIDALRRA